MTKEEEDLYAKDLITSFIPKGFKLEDCEYTRIDISPDASRKPLEARGCV